MNILIKNTKALVYENNEFRIKTCDIYISGKVISGIDTMPDGFTADKVIDGSSFLTVPGLINCHSHTYMSAFRNLADDLPFEKWLFESISPREDRMKPEDAYSCSLLTFCEMVKTGTTTFADMHMFRNMSARAADETGMRAVMTRGLVGSDRNDEGGLKRLDDLFDEMKNYGDNDRFSFMVAPHAIYTCGEDYIRYCSEIALEKGLGVHVHLSETTAEVENCKKQHGGMSPVEYLDSLGLFRSNTIAAHCVHLSDSDIDILKARNVSPIHNPKSNLKLGNGIAPVAKMLDKKLNVCLGTDSQASNNMNNMFSEMNFASLIHKAGGDALAVGAQDVLKMATINGAAALRINSGEIAVGKLADIALLRLDRPSFIPENDLVSALVYSADGHETDTVIINGEIVLENGRMTKVDEEKIYHDAKEAVRRLG